MSSDNLTSKVDPEAQKYARDVRKNDLYCAERDMAICTDWNRVYLADYVDRLTRREAELVKALDVACDVLEAAGYIEAANGSRAAMKEAT